jgi:hypothetical protein
MRTLKNSVREMVNKSEIRSKVSWHRDTPAGLKFVLHGIDVDLLVTRDSTSLGKPITYADPETRFYMASLVQGQVYFVKKKAKAVELDVIIGIKRWIKQLCWTDNARPSSYLIELLVIHVSQTELKRLTNLNPSWAKCDVFPNNPTNRSFLFRKTVETLVDLPSARISFGTVFKKHIPPSNKAYVLDPVNPTNNLLDKLNLHLIAFVAKKALKLRE